MHSEAPASETTFLGNYSVGRPADALPGDWGYINDLGVAVFIGRLMASLKASDAAKIEAFWGDDLLRVVGYNFELFTAGSEEQKLNDEGEISEVRRSSPYPWEALGLGTRGGATTRKADGKLTRGSEYASEEPKDDKQLIIPRLTQLGGYLGDLQRDIVSAPPEGLEIETLDESAKTLHVGLADFVRSSDGLAALRSAKGLIFEKYSLIPVPKQLKAQEDPTGDSADDDYVPAGADDEVPEFAWDDTEPVGVRQAQLFDCLAWIWNRYTCAGLVKHEKDWYYPNELELEKPVDGAVYDKSLDALKSRFMLELPNFKTVKIDHRDGRGAIRYYQSRSVVAQLDDGTVIMEDGYGASITMRGGSIILDAPGDVWVKTGRSFVTWAAFDAEIKAGNCVDISSSKKDVRIKAEKNLHMLGGNDGQVGGVLIESRSQGRNTASGFANGGERTVGAGITLKSEKGAVDIFGRDVYVGLTDQSGMLAIDGGPGRLFLAGDEVAVKADLLFSAMVGQDSMLAISAQEAVISSRLRVGGDLTVAPADPENATVKFILGGPLYALGSGIFDDVVVSNTGFAAHGSPGVAPLKDPVDFGTTPRELGDGISQEVQSINDRNADQVDLLRNNTEFSPGNEDYQSHIRFSCRDSELDLKLDSDSFLIFESRWQQMARTGNIGGKDVWGEEPTVLGVNDEPTAPHPGYQAWNNWSAFATVDLNNFADGKAIARAGMTEKGGALSKAQLSEEYTVVAKP